MAGDAVAGTPAAPQGKAFFDTNVLVHSCDASEPRKRDAARALLLDHLAAGTMSSVRARCHRVDGDDAISGVALLPADG